MGTRFDNAPQDVSWLLGLFFVVLVVAPAAVLALIRLAFAWFDYVWAPLIRFLFL